MMMEEQTKRDLESLLAEQDNGWCAYDPDYNPIVKTGNGGCILQQMHRVLGDAEHNERRRRMDNMMAALGFQNVVRMYHWNDDQRDPEAVRQRIRGALETDWVLTR